MAYDHDTLGRTDLSRGHEHDGPDAGRAEGSGDAGTGGAVGGLAFNSSERRGGRQGADGGRQYDGSAPRRVEDDYVSRRVGEVGDGSSRPGPVNGFWAAADWLSCRDERWRPVESEYVEMVDGPAARVGPSCHQRASVADEEEAASRLQALFDCLGAEAIQRQAGGQRSLCEEGVLRPVLHGGLDGGPDEGPVDQEQPPTIGEDGRAFLRDLQSPGQSVVGPSSGRKSDEQHPVEFADIVRLLPRSLSFAEFRGRRNDADELRLLWGAIAEEGGLLHSFGPLETTWASLSQDAQDRIRLGFDVGAWRRVVPVPLAVAAPARVGRLRGYGNAIVAEVAEGFIRSFLEAEASGFAPDVGSGGLTAEIEDLLS